MIDMIYQWIKNILIYIVLVTIIVNLLPQGQYKKYIKVFTGLILILIVISPITELTGISNKINFHLIDNKFALKQDELLKQYKVLEESQQGIILEEYKKELSEQIKLILEQEKIYVENIRLEINTNISERGYGEIKELYIEASTEKVKKSKTIKVDKIIISKPESTEVKTSEEIVYEKKIKSLLSNFYNLSIDNIYISINR